MAQSTKVSRKPETDQIKDMDMLVDEQKPRTITEKNSGTRSSSLPGSFAAHLGLEGGSPVQVSLNPGQPILVDEPCIIIRPHPEASNNE